MRIHEKQTLREILKDFTNRQLISDYRKSVIHLNDVTEAKNKGWDYYLGENINRVYADAKQGLELVLDELNNRDYEIWKIKNIPAIITAKTLKQLANEEIEKIEARKIAQAKAEAEQTAAAQKPAIDAIKSFAVFQLNYQHDFIEAAFAGGMVDHLRSKFNSIHHQHGPKAAMIMFWSELDFENRNLLAKYIIDRNIK